MNSTKKQILLHLEQTIALGNEIIAEAEKEDFVLENYHENLEKFVQFMSENKNSNFLVAKKLNAIERYSDHKDYDLKVNIFLKKILPPSKKDNRKKNMVNYIKRQNLLLQAIAYYLKHES